MFISTKNIRVNICKGVFIYARDTYWQNTIAKQHQTHVLNFTVQENVHKMINEKKMIFLPNNCFMTENLLLQYWLLLQ